MRVTVHKLLVRAVVPLLLLAVLAVSMRTVRAAQAGQPAGQAAVGQVQVAPTEDAGGEANG